MSSTRQLLEEQYTDHSTELVPSLESLMDLRLEQEVGTEGFGDFVRNQVQNVSTYFGDKARNWKEGKPVKLGSQSVFSSVLRRQLAALEMFYQNENWLNKRRFVEGQVSAKNIGSFLLTATGNDDTVVDEAAINSVHQYIQGWIDDHHQQCGTWLKRIEPYSKRMQVEPLTKDFFNEVLQAVTSSGHPDRETVLKLERNFKIELGNRRWMDSYPTRPQFKTTGKIDALTIEGVQEAAAIMHTLLSYCLAIENQYFTLCNSWEVNFANANWSGWQQLGELRHGKNEIFKAGDEIADEQENPYARIAYRAARAHFTDPATADRWEVLLDRYFTGNAFQIQHGLLSPLYDIAHALGRYIDRSIR